MNDRELKSIIESILFVWSEPIHIDEIMSVIGTDKRTTRTLLKELQDECDHYRRGIIINERDGYFQMSTRQEHFDILSKLVKQTKRKIGNSTMEVLAIIAYKQPITRVEIDNIRGIKSYSSIETLRDRGLIEEIGRSEAIGRPIIYGTGPEFLRAFDLQSLDQLPPIDNIDSLDQILDDSNDEN